MEVTKLRLGRGNLTTPASREGLSVTRLEMLGLVISAGASQLN